MKRFLAASMIIFATSGLLINTPVEAKRMGGGSSMGMKRATPPPAQAPAAAPQQAPAQSAAAAPANGSTTPARANGSSKWLGPLAGLGIGAGLMALFGGSALGAALGSIFSMLLLGALIFFLFKMLRRKSHTAPAPAMQPAMQYAGHTTITPDVYAPKTDPVAASPATGVSTTAPSEPARIPPGFDMEGFLHQAKVAFIRLQAANDASDLADIRHFTTPQLYTELAKQVQERHNAPQKTEVVTLNAELLEVITEPNRTIASVRYTGLIREDDASDSATPFSETWHVMKDLTQASPAWHIAGIEQDNIEPR